ncbi:peptidoglycan DD-metalloendopeptidase family protein [Candidatus Peregrinibacteria bacterium]|nr:peptidoglycan DD-metalloendopeptidase family protein [Candidatus Peregrinibacteria bacterium]
MPSNAETQYFDYVQKNAEKGRSSEASELLDKALAGRSEDKCDWLREGREYVSELKKLEEAQANGEKDLNAHYEKLKGIARDLANYQQALLRAEIEAGRESNKTQAEKDWDRNWKYFTEHPIIGFVPMAIAWFKKSFGGGASPENAEDDEIAFDDSTESGEEPPEQPGLRLSLPAGATLTSDIQTHRESTGKAHSGIDIAGMPEGTPLYCPGEGVVVGKGFKNSNGNYVYIRYMIGGKPYTFCFLHLQEMSPLKQGQRVGADTVFGKVGHTGHVVPGPGGKGDHLHFQVYDSAHKVIDPMPFLPADIQGEVLAKREGKSDAYWGEQRAVA